MKLQILLLALVVAALSSCTSAYKTGQTPDDVYYSPTRPGDEYVRTEKKDDRRYESREEYYDDRFLRMRVQNPYRWSQLDDYYFNNPYAYNYYGNYSSWNNPWNSYWQWNNYYNPYCHAGGGVIIKNPGAYRPPPSKPIAFNPQSYLGSNAGSTSSSSGSYYSPRGSSSGSGLPRYNNSNSGYNSYNSGSNSSHSSGSSYTPSSSTPSRSYTPSSSSSSSSGSSSSSSGSSGSSGSSRPPR